MSLDAVARPHAAHDPSVVRSLLDEHRQARTDQISALSLTTPAESDLDPAARLRVLAAARLALEEIDAALQRLGEGAYGFCAGCAEPIPSERLRAVPYARHCVPCA